MDYDEFTERLKLEIQESLSRQITFIESVVNKTNEMLEALTIRLDNQEFAQTVYPQKLYQDYQDGVSFSKIADLVSASLMMETPQIPDLTIKNAEKCISFSLLNKEKNKQLLKECPYKEINDLVAVPRWHVSDGASFLVTNNVMQHLKLTKEEVLSIAQKNTESGKYFCKSMDEIIRDMMAEDGLPEVFADEMCPMVQSPLYVLTNKHNFDGSCAILSDSFMQDVAEKTGAEELYLLPSSRHEMIAVNAAMVDNPSSLKSIVVGVNSDPNVIRAEDYLSDSIYEYNAVTHSLSMCDHNGLFHDKQSQNGSIKQTISRGRD